MIEKPTFATKQEEIQWIIKNKDLIITEKKNTIKRADALTQSYNHVDKQGANKAESMEGNDIGVLKASLVINTTGLMDSHCDVHIEGIWKKTLQENSITYLLQEHEMEFEKVIADSINDELKASTKTMSWKSLGFDFGGNTQALVFDTNISKQRNPFMFEQYKKGYVLNHSVGMRYVKMYLCIDTDEPMDAQYKENWDKYYPSVANKDVADKKGYFWAVTEAKMIEGSAVVKGSNYATPTISIEQKEDNEAVADTSLDSTWLKIRDLQINNF
jgi:hypothetical protein